MRHDIGAAGDRREREAAADDLAQGANIGDDAVIFLRAAVGEAEASDDLVEDQQQAVLGRELAQALEESRLGRDQALQRLDNDSRSLNGATSTSSCRLLGMPAESGIGRGKLLERRGERLMSP